jgi:hypothetical protein
MVNSRYRHPDLSVWLHDVFGNMSAPSQPFMFQIAAGDAFVGTILY